MRLALLVVKGTHLGPNQVHECAIFTKSRHSNVCMAKIVQEIAGHAFAACVSNRVLTHTHIYLSTAASTATSTAASTATSTATSTAANLAASTTTSAPSKSIIIHQVSG